MIGIMISVALLLSIVVLIIVTRNYEKEDIDVLDKKEYKLYQIMPTSLFLMDKVFKIKHLTTRDYKIKQQLAMLYGEKISAYKLRLYVADKISLIILILFSFSFLGLVIGYSDYQNTYLIEGNTLLRPGYNQGATSYELDLTIKTENEILNESIEVMVEPKSLTTEQALRLLENSLEYLKVYILGENESLNNVQYPLKLIKEIPGTQIKVNWESSHPEIIDSNGMIDFKDITEEGIYVSLLPTLVYGDIQLKHNLIVQVWPRVISQKELLESNLNRMLDELNKEGLENSEVVLPSEIGDGEVQLVWAEPKDSMALKILMVGLFVSVVIYFAKEEDLKKKVEERNQQIRLDFPEFISKLSLLISAGMTVSKAWEKLINDYRNQKQEMAYRYLYEEAIVAYLEIQGGQSELRAYERFGRRCKLPELMKFSSIIIQNIRKGTSTLIEALNEQGEEAWGKRKEVAKLLGEQASTKLLLPMMMMLLIVIVIIMVPALMSMSM
ncbi:type II secretion system protein F (GspF) [Natranaerovirga pectinivora]|uniref:Type II secretion system protein F (GspF) n=1 Tax=Natranaerovirga pectinivora TaxID=682400 RepID=A0A4R3MDM3_9FIRM|nr:type II secretion system F family protein [Natranaerovirga pectinivora]TCT11651.1 type II secretion system protein F (GspF) [Natranaerovirga pectinivora]